MRSLQFFRVPLRESLHTHVTSEKREDGWCHGTPHRPRTDGDNRETFTSRTRAAAVRVLGARLAVTVVCGNVVAWAIRWWTVVSCGRRRQESVHGIRSGLASSSVRHRNCEPRSIFPSGRNKFRWRTPPTREGFRLVCFWGKKKFQMFTQKHWTLLLDVVLFLSGK